MADEPENVMLKLMRDMREEMHAIRADNQHIKQRIDEMHETLYTSAGIAMHTSVKQDTLTKRIDTLEARLVKLEEKA
ncbi:MAG: hypothetical protein AAGF29_00260 [Pseudomonadota bacterium]